MQEKDFRFVTGRRHEVFFSKFRLEAPCVSIFFFLSVISPGELDIMSKFGADKFLSHSY